MMDDYYYPRSEDLQDRNGSLKASSPRSPQGGSPMAWFGKSVLTIVTYTVYALAIVGAGGVYVVVQLLRGQMTPDDVGMIAQNVQEGWVLVTTIAGSGIASAFARYGLPAFREYRRFVSEARDSNLDDRIARIVQSVIGGKP